MKQQRFRARIQKPAGRGTRTYITVPFDVEKLYGTRGQARVRGSLNDIDFTGVLYPRGDGTHYLVVNSQLRGKLRAAEGDEVLVVVEKDPTPPLLEIPESFAAALEADAKARKVSEALSPSHKREYARFINEAKKEETVRRRVASAMEMLKREKT